jgi:hypothetical protein
VCTDTKGRADNAGAWRKARKNRRFRGGFMASLLTGFGAGVGVDFGAESDLDNLRGLPAHNILQGVFLVFRRRPITARLRNSNA